MAKTFTVKVDFLAATNIGKITEQMKTSMKSVSRASETMNRSIQKNKAAFDSLNKAATRATKAIGASFVAGVGASILAGSKFEEGLQELSAITGLQGQALQNFGADAVAMGKQMGISATSYLDGVKLIASAKPELLKSPELLKAITDEALVMSKAGKMSLDAAADSLTTAMNQFQLGAEDSSRAINVLAAGSKMGSSFINETSQAIRNAGVSARLAGLNFEETNAAIQVLAAGGIKGSEAGTQLQAVFLAMAGLSDEFNPKIVGINKALENFSKAGLDATQMEDVFQRRGLKAAAILIEQKDAFANMVDSITGTQIAYEQAEINMKAFNEVAKRLGSTIQAALIKAFLKMAPVLTKIVNKLVEFFSFIGNHLDLVVKLAGVVTALTAAFWAFILPTKILAFLPVAKSILSMVAAMWSFNIAILANPITWVIAGIVAAIAVLGYAIYRYWDIVKPALIDVWEQAREAFGPSLATLFELLQQLWTVAKPVLTFIAKIVGTVLVSAFLGFLEVVKLTMKWLETMFKPLAWLLEKIQKLIDKKKELKGDVSGGINVGDIPELRIPDMDTALINSNTNQSLAISMRVDSEGRPSIEDVSSDGDIDFDADLGHMEPLLGI